QSDMIAGLDPLLPEAGGGVVDGVIKLPETPPLVAKDEGHSLRGEIGPAAKPFGHGLACRVVSATGRPGRRSRRTSRGYHSRLAAKSSPKRRCSRPVPLSAGMSSRPFWVCTILTSRSARGKVSHGSQKSEESQPAAHIARGER